MRERGIEPPSRRKADSAALTALAEPGFVPVQVAPAVEARVIRLEANQTIHTTWTADALVAVAGQIGVQLPPRPRSLTDYEPMSGEEPQ